MKIAIEPLSGIWFDAVVFGIRFKRCRLYRGPSGLPDLRVPRYVDLPPEMFNALRRRAVEVMGDRVGGP